MSKRPAENEREREEEEESATKRLSAEHTEASSQPSSDTRAWKIFVGGIDQQVTTPELTVYFQQYGATVDCVVMTDRATGRPRGFGFVTFKNQDAFDNALANKSHELRGKWMELKAAEPAGRAPPPASLANTQKNLHISSVQPGTTKEQVLSRRANK